MLLAPYALATLSQLCRRERVSLVYASGEPPAALLRGWLLAQAVGLPLCLDLRDPWSLNFLQRGKPAWVRRAERRMEHFLFRRANRLVFTSATTRNRYAALYPLINPEKMVTVYTGYDPLACGSAPPAPAEALSAGRRPTTMTLMHFGNCYGLRSLETVLRALHRLRLRGLWPSAGVQLRNYGRVRARDVRLAAELGLSSIFEHRPAVSYRHGLAELASADLLVLLGYGEETGFIPAKTFDYLMVRRPILCVTTCPELGGIIHEAGGVGGGPCGRGGGRVGYRVHRRRRPWKCRRRRCRRCRAL